MYGRLRGVLPDLTPFRESPAFFRLWAGNLVSGIGSQMTIVAVSLEIYKITQSTFMVGLTGLFTLVPSLVVGLYGGSWVDKYDRRKIALISATVVWLSTALIAIHAWAGLEWVWILYVLSGINAAGFAVLFTAKNAITPRILRPETMPAALALTGILMGSMVTVGPALAGILVARVGYAWTYTVDVVLFCTMFFGLVTLPAIAPATKVTTAGFKSVVEGFKYLRTAPPLMMGFVLDLAAMTFGSPRVLFPALGALVLGGGAATVGWLTAAGALGTLACGIFSGKLSHFYRHGRAVVISVAVYAVIIGLLGVVILAAQLTGGAVHGPRAPWLIAAFVLLFLAGAADNVSMIYRNTIATVGVPDHVRGRIQGMYIVSVNAGPRMGDLYAGALAAVALWFPPILGLALTVLVIYLALRMYPEYLKFHAQAEGQN